MPHDIAITDGHDARLADYRDLTDSKVRAEEFAGNSGWFIAEGEGVVRHLVAAVGTSSSPGTGSGSGVRFALRSVLITPHHREKLADCLDGLDAQVPVYAAPPALMETITGFAFHRGVLASGAVRALPTLAKVLATSRVLVIAEDLTNIENIGAVFRNVACLVGAGSAVALTARCCWPLYRKALRVSMGHALRVPFATLPRWPEALVQVREAGFTTLALTPAPDAVDIHTLKYARGQKLALVVGAEGPGLSTQAMAACDQRVRIPMAAGADSLNVATALAVALSHVAGAGE